jgi:hypothetical protein
MGKRIAAWLVAAVVVGAMGAGTYLVTEARGQRRSTAALEQLPPLQPAGQAEAAAAPSQDRVAVAVGPSPGFAQVTYRVKGSLPDLPDQARAWKLTPAATTERVAALASALGMAGQPRSTPWGWTVTDAGRTLYVSSAAGQSWTYTVYGQVAGCRESGAIRPRPACPVAGEAGQGSAGSPGGTASATQGGAGSAATVSSTVPGDIPVPAISEETPKLRPRSCASAGRCVT